MAKRVKEETVERTKETAYYICDKCRGQNHEETTFEEDLNKVVFGAEQMIGYSMTANTFEAHGTAHGIARDDSPDIVGDHEYLLCDECMEKAHDYLSDFF